MELSRGSPFGELPARAPFSSPDIAARPAPFLAPPPQVPPSSSWPGRVQRSGQQDANCPRGATLPPPCPERGRPRAVPSSPPLAAAPGDRGAPLGAQALPQPGLARPGRERALGLRLLQAPLPRHHLHLLGGALLPRASQPAGPGRAASLAAMLGRDCLAREAAKGLRRPSTSRGRQGRLIFCGRQSNSQADSLGSCPVGSALAPEWNSRIPGGGGGGTDMPLLPGSRLFRRNIAEELPCAPPSGAASL